MTDDNLKFVTSINTSSRVTTRMNAGVMSPKYREYSELLDFVTHQSKYNRNMEKIDNAIKNIRLYENQRDFEIISRAVNLNIKTP